MAWSLVENFRPAKNADERTAQCLRQSRQRGEFFFQQQPGASRHSCLRQGRDGRFGAVGGGKSVHNEDIAASGIALRQSRVVGKFADIKAGIFEQQYFARRRFLQLLAKAHRAGQEFS